MKFKPENIVNIDKNPLMRESDRGCVLICSSDIENILSKILESYIDEVSNISKSDKRTLFDYTGPLGTFSSKILLSYSIGLLNSNLYSDIKAVKILRNRAAHSNSNFSLSDKENSILIESMNYYNDNIKKIKRYSLKSGKQNDDSFNESIAKGYGFVRHDKSRFILIVSYLKIELVTLNIISDLIAQNFTKIKLDITKKLNDSLKNNGWMNKEDATL